MQLLKALKLLESSKEEQIEYLIKLGTYPSTDELALEFDDAYEVFLGITDENANKYNYSKEVITSLEEIN